MEKNKREGRHTERKTDTERDREMETHPEKGQIFTLEINQLLLWAPSSSYI